MWKIILNLEKYYEFFKDFYYEKVLKILKFFKNLLVIEFLEKEIEVIFEFFILEVDDEIIVCLNDESYLMISLEESCFENSDYLKEKLKEVKDLIDVLNLRKVMIYKIGFMFLEY